MARLDDIRATSTWSDILEGQPQHLGLAFLLSLGALSLVAPETHPPEVLGLTTVGWVRLSILLAVIHQILVAIVFRLQLHRNVMTRLFGAHDMTVWGAVFLPLLAARPLTVLFAAIADTAPITSHRWVEVALAVPLLAVAGWAMHSTIVHFTIPRALGGDHFRQEIADLPMVNRGAFRHTANAMYGLVFLGLWGIALLFGSWNALVLALFQHCYIWVHMYCTEAPDMRWIYRDG